MKFYKLKDYLKLDDCSRIFTIEIVNEPSAIEYFKSFFGILKPWPKVEIKNQDILYCCDEKDLWYYVDKSCVDDDANITVPDFTPCTIEDIEIFSCFLNLINARININYTVILN